MEMLFSRVQLILPSARRIAVRFIAAFLVASCLAPPVVRAATFSAGLDRSTITLGETATLSLTFIGGSPENVPAPPAIPNLQINYVGPSSQISILNNQVSSTVTHNFTVTPRQPGDFSIPAFAAQVGGESLTTQPLTLKVLKPESPSPEAVNSGSELALLKLALPKKDVYVGEIIAAELQLYVREGVQNVENFQLTALPAEGFTVSKLVQGNRRQARLGGVAYTIIPLTMALKPVKTGNLNVGPVTASIVLDLPSTRRRRDPLEQFGFRDPFGPPVEQKQVTLATDAQSLQSLALPMQNVPANFNGAVGNFTMTMTAGPTTVAVGDPITVRVQISGRGALDSLTLPEQPAWRDFKTYPPTSKVETSDPLGVQGTRTFEQLIAPQNAEIKELPPISFSFFDPGQKSYRTLTQPAVKLVVRPSASASPTVAATARGPQDNAPPTEDIVPNKQRLGTVAPLATPLVQQS